MGIQGKLLSAIWICVLTVALGYSASKSREFSRARTTTLTPPPLTSLDTRLIDIVTLGYRLTYDDYVSVWMLQMYTEEDLAQIETEEFYRLVRSVTTHRPRSQSIYTMSCFFFGLERGRPDLCEPIILDGIKALPDDWLIPTIMGFMYGVHQKEQEKAALYYGLAASKPNVPEFLQSLAARTVRENKVDVSILNKTIEELAGREGGKKFLNVIKKMEKRKSIERNPGDE